MVLFIGDCLASLRQVAFLFNCQPVCQFRPWKSNDIPPFFPLPTELVSQNILRMQEPLKSINQRSPPGEKIALFRPLFRGRDDVYPRRFESKKTGKSGYQPACANEWVRDVCDKRKTKCAECPNRRFLPVTDAVVNHHLSGRDDTGRHFVMGVYPMLQDETCYFLALDFDGEKWREDVCAVKETCSRLGMPACIERSRSGNGAHLWLFFDEAVPAVLARKLGSHILTETMERRPELGLDSYDRFFPNQDTLPHGGFGNLIALPLQKQPREQGNTVFVDDHLVPYPDQWAFLSSIERITNAKAQTIVALAERRDRVIGVRLYPDEGANEQPWLLPPSRRPSEPLLSGPLPKSLNVIIGNEIYIEKEPLPPALRNRLIRLAAFQNPEFYRAQAMRLPTFDKPRIIACAEEHPRHLALPRGCMEEMQNLLKHLGIGISIQDARNPGKPLNVSFRGQLRPEQKAAADALAAHDTGVLSATTAFGKTVVASWLIAHRGVNTLVLVHRRQLLEQWVERLATFLDISSKDIGRIGGGKKKAGGKLDVALIQSLVRKGVVDDIAGQYGHLIVDECHRLPAPSFEQVARRAKARYVTGLSATVTRKDGHHPIIMMQCGPIRHRVDAKQQAALRPFDHVVLARPTSFRPLPSDNPDARTQFHDLCSAIAADNARNQLICEDVNQALKEGRSPIVLTERKEHLAALERLLSFAAHHLIVLRGAMGRKAIRTARERLAAIPDNESRILLATGKYIGEGFDDARLDTLFLTMPISWRGTVAQYAGRLHRSHDNKREVRIYDYADLNVPMLEKMFNRRCKGYEAIGYRILLPASAIPGWPAEVPLSVESAWKQDYAVSVRRLVCDGVDSPLAELFVSATRQIPADAAGADRARSSSEAFLYRRLETLQETKGRFCLNAELPIQFNGHGKMEVDLLCAEAKIAIEIDGAHHLNDPNAYRRDRRKDALLQENGYFVPRFLADDIGKRLDDVLDRILRTLAGRPRARS